jgi:hypothetical protein
VIDIWRLVLIFADSLLAIFVVLAGYQILFSGFSPRYAEALEELPRLLFAGVGANISLLFARFWIDLNDLICGILFFQAAGHLFAVFVLVAVLNILVLALFALLILLMLLLGIQMAVRLGIILLLLVCLPILFLLLASRHTRHIGQAGITSYITVVMVQSLQILTLTLGVRVLVPFLELNINPSTVLAPLATILSGIVLLWLVLRIPGMLRHWALQPIAEASQEAHRRIIIATSRALRLALM